MELNWSVKEQNLLDSLESKDLFIVMNFSNRSDDLVNELQKYIQPSMTKDYHYLNTKSGFYNNVPFAIMEFTENRDNGLEKRFLVSKSLSKLKEVFSKKHLKVYFNCDDLTMLDVSIAEDCISTHYEKFYKKNDLETAYFYSSSASSFDLKRLNTRFKYNLQFRSWINENPDELTSIEIGKRLEIFSNENSNCEFSSLGLDELKKLGMNLLLAVGQGSELSPSRCHIVTANLGKTTQKPLMLVGKGITFDTGGINVKAFESYVNTMKNDMGGAALMSNIFMSLVESGYDQPILLVIPCCENLVAQKSMKPGSIIKSYKGKEVVIEHTDAEGRLILADALAYAEKMYSPRKTMVAATLTTAALRQFTNYFTPVHFADSNFKNKLSSKAKELGEGFVFWDEFAPFKDANLSPAADLTNMGRLNATASIGGGSNCAAHFLKEFVDGPLVHFDIFASTWNWSNNYPGANYGATGAAFNSLFESLLDE